MTDGSSYLKIHVFKRQKQIINGNIVQTRMHSSRMRTARSSSHQLWGVCFRACWDTLPPGVGLETPPRCGPGATLDVGLEPPQVWAWRTPMARPLNLPLGVDLETPPGQTPQLPPGGGPGDPPQPDPSSSPWVWAWKPARHAGIHTPPPLETCKACWDTTCKACLDTTPPPSKQNDWQPYVKT